MKRAGASGVGSHFVSFGEVANINTDNLVVSEMLRMRPTRHRRYDTGSATDIHLE